MNPAHFDTNYYLRKNPDLALAVKKYKSPEVQKSFLITHFFTAGKNEHRRHRFVSDPVPSSGAGIINHTKVSLNQLTDTYKKIHKTNTIDFPRETDIINKLIKSYQKKYC